MEYASIDIPHFRSNLYDACNYKQKYLIKDVSRTTTVKHVYSQRVYYFLQILMNSY
jgi:hypothetical protein